jgi:hypothetical protein
MKGLNAIYFGHDGIGIEQMYQSRAACLNDGHHPLSQSDSYYLVSFALFLWSMKPVGKKKASSDQPMVHERYLVPEQNPRFNTERVPEEDEPVPEESRWLIEDEEDIMTEHDEQPPAGEGP